MTVAPDLVELRERVARIISPQTFELIEHYDGLLQSKPGDAFKAYPSLRTQRDEALAKADAILALQQVERTEVADDAAEFADWHRRVREWSGSSFLAGERMSAEKQLDAKGALYSDLCSLGNFLLWWADRLASPRGGEGEEEGSSRDNDPGTGSSVLRAALTVAKAALEHLGDPSYMRGEWIGGEMVYQWIGAEDFQVIARQAVGRIEGILAATPRPAEHTQDGEPSGWVLVPREPTEEMIEAAKAALAKWRDGLPLDEKMLRHVLKSGRGYTEATEDEKHQLRWAAMIAAAPPPPENSLSGRTGDLPKTGLLRDTVKTDPSPDLKLALEALEAIAGGEGFADVIAQQTLDQIKASQKGGDRG